jgi:hypothetical protein
LPRTFAIRRRGLIISFLHQEEVTRHLSAILTSRDTFHPVKSRQFGLVPP